MPMITAHIRNGQIVPDEPIDLPEGAEVRVHLTEQAAPPASPADQPTRKLGETLADVFRDFIGVAGDLPPDASTTYRDEIYQDPHNERGRK